MHHDVEDLLSPDSTSIMSRCTANKNYKLYPPLHSLLQLASHHRFLGLFDADLSPSNITLIDITAAIAAERLVERAGRELDERGGARGCAFVECAHVPVAGEQNHALGAGLGDEPQQPLALARQVAPTLKPMPFGQHLDA